MNFLASAFLWGAALAALPVIVHLVAGRKRETVRWGAMQFLKETERQKKRRLRRPAHLVLMVARMLAIAAVALAFAQPVAQWEVLQPVPARDIVMVVDNSMSLTLETADGPSADALRHRATAVVGRLHRRDRVRLLAAAGTPGWIDDQPVRGGSDSVGDTLRQIDHPPLPAGLPEAVLQALRAKPAKDGATREVVVLTDGQRHGWRLEDTAAWKAVRTEAGETAITVIPLDAIEGPMWNVDLAELAPESAVVPTGDPVRVHATVRNRTAVPSEALTLHWYLGEEKISLASVPAIPPGGSKELVLDYRPEAPGCLVFRAALDVTDAILLDNDASAVVEVGRKIPVLLVDGSGSRNPQRSDTRFVVAALAGGDDGVSTYALDTVDATRLPIDELARYRAIIFSNVGELPPAQGAAMATYLRGKGGLLIAPGDKADPDIFSIDFFGEGSYLSPLPLSSTVGDPRDRDRYETVAVADFQHPAMKLFAEAGQLDLPSARVYRRHVFDTSYASDFSVLLEADNGDPLAVAGGGEGGRVVLLATPLSLSWSNLPQLNFYVAMLHEWLWYLIEPGMAKRNLSAGEPIVESLAKEDTDAVWKLTPPSGEAIDFAPRTVGGRRTCRFDRTAHPGVYWITAHDGLPPSGFAVARDPDESDLTPLNLEEKAELTAMAGLKFGKVDDLFTAPVTEGKETERPFWQIVLLALLVLMVIEAIIALVIQKRRRSPEEAAQANPISF